jgi:HAMP domain-containing protein
MDDPDSTVVRSRPTPAADPDATVVRPQLQRPVAPPAAPSSDARGTRPEPTGFPATRSFHRDAPPAAPAPARDRDATTVYAAPAPRTRSGAVARQPMSPLAKPRAAAAPPADDSDATVIRNTLLRPRTPQPGPAQDDATVLRPLPKRSLALPAGARLHEYRVDRVLGQGGFGITYLATDANLDAQVAIKEYLPEEISYRASDASVSPNASQHRDRYEQGLENFLTEARTLATFRHPNIVRVARFFEANHTAYMVLEYERGASFKKWWLAQDQTQGRGERLLAERLQPLLDGLSAVHAAGYLHRDIKPDNIQVRDEDGRLVLLDFGSSGQTVALADQDAVVVTPGYAPVEQYGLGEQGAWTDIYALAATLYWAVTGSKPADAEARAGGVVLQPAVQAGQGRYGRSFLEAIDWALQMDAAARPATVEQWRDKLLADHVSSLGLKEALRRGDSQDEGESASTGLQARLGGRLARLWRQGLSPSAWSLSVKLALAMLVTALVPMLLTGLYNLGGAKTALQESQLRKTELMAYNTAGRLGQLLGDSAKLARGLGGDAELARWLSAPNEMGLEVLQQRLEALAKANADIHFVMVMDAAGGVRISTDRDLLGRNFAFREYHKSAMAGRSFTTGIVVGAAAGAAGVFFAEPVRDETGQVVGAVVLRVRATAFGSILDEVRHDAQLTPLMVDGDGVVVHHPKQDLMFRSLMPLDAAVQQRIKADQRFRRDRIDSLNEPELAEAMRSRNGIGHASYRSTTSGVDEIAGFATVPGHNWTVVVSQTREAFEQPVQRLMTHLQLSLAVVGLLFTALALRFARGIVRPVQQLTAGADALKSGRFEQAYVKVKNRDELGQLARTFNVMVDVLRQREREREHRKT